MVVPVQAVPTYFRQRRLPPKERCLQGDPVQTQVIKLVRCALIEAHVLELKDHVQLAPSRIGVEPRLFGVTAGISPTVMNSPSRPAKTSRVTSAR